MIDVPRGRLSHRSTCDSVQGTGCAISQSSMSMLTEALRGKTAEAAFALGQEEVVAMLGIPIGPVRMKCAMLGLRTVQDALASLRSTH